MKKLLYPLCSLSLLVASSAHAQFLVDFGATNNPDPQNVQAGYNDWSYDSATADTTALISFTNDLALDTQIGVRVTRGTSGPGLDPRNYDSITSGSFLGQSNLLEDIAQTASLTLELSGLEYGSYQMTTYHHATQYTFSAFDAELTDADNTSGTTIASAVTPTTGVSPESITTLVFNFKVDETTPNMSLLLNAGGSNAIINGFDLISIPESSQYPMIFGSVMLLGALAVRRRVVA